MCFYLDAPSAPHFDGDAEDDNGNDDDGDLWPRSHFSSKLLSIGSIIFQPARRCLELVSV